MFFRVGPAECAIVLLLLFVVVGIVILGIRTRRGGGSPGEKKHYPSQRICGDRYALYTFREMFTVI